LHHRKGRELHGAYLAEGERILAELPASEASVLFGVALAESAARLRRILPGSPIYLLSERQQDLFATNSPQGMGAVVEMPPPTPHEILRRATVPLIHLEGIADPGNLGTIIRTADWFGYGALSLSIGSVDPYNPKAVRSSMGGIFRLPIVLDVTLNALLDTRRPLLALDLAGSDLRTIPLPADGIYVVGREAVGISDDVRSVAQLVSIGGAGRGDSLNASVAAAILLYELSRRRDHDLYQPT